MKQSKSIFERIKLYRINHIRNKNKIKDDKITKEGTSNKAIKKQSKIKIFFKFLIGFIAAFFEYLVMKSNKKKSIKNNGSAINTAKNQTSNEVKNNNDNQNVLEIDKNNTISPFYIEKIKINVVDNSNKINTEPKKSDEIIIKQIDDYNKANSKVEENNKVLTKKIDNYKNNVVKNQSDELQQKKKELVFIEEQIIYADNYDELEIAKSKILKTKQELQLKKSNNLVAVKNLEEDKKQVVKNTENEIEQDKFVDRVATQASVDNLNSSLIKEEPKVSETLKNTDELKKESQTLIIETIPKTKQDIVNNNEEIDKLIERCDEDLTLVEDKKEYIELQEKYEEQLNSVENNSQDFKLTKKDLKQIKNNVNDILDRQKYNLEQLNRYMNMSNDSQKFMAKISNFFRSTAKLSFSVVPFFVFPNRLLGLTTSAIMFNNSLKSYRMKPDDNYINQNIKMMVTNNELCLKAGINASKDALNEIDNIKFYLNNVPNEVKDTLEYRKYLVNVYSTEKIIKKQIEALQKMSKNYQDIKVKVKRKDY